MDAFTAPARPRTACATLPHFYADLRFVRLSTPAQQLLIRLWLEASMRSSSRFPADAGQLIYWMGEIYRSELEEEWSTALNELYLNFFIIGTGDGHETNVLCSWEDFGDVQNADNRRAETGRVSALARWHRAGKHAETKTDCPLCIQDGAVR